MNKKLILAAGISSVMLLGGCASGTDETTMDQTTSQIQALNDKIDQLTQEVEALKASQSDLDESQAIEEAMVAVEEARDAAVAAQAEAVRANERIDNIAQSYTK